MHHVGRFDASSLRIPAEYEGHSQGFSRAVLIDNTVGSVHMGHGICQLLPDGTLDRHVHSFEEGFFVLEGRILIDLDGRSYELGAGDYGTIPVSTPHAWRGVGAEPARWLEMLAPQPKPPDGARDTFFLPSGNPPPAGEPLDVRDPRTRWLGHFEDRQLPPPSQLQMDGYRGGNIHGISLKMLVDRMLGAQHMTLFMVEFQPGGEGNVHDHPFEESYFILRGEAEAVLDGERYAVGPGDIVWTGVGGTHGFFNRGTEPVRWLETQAPQPPAQQAFRFKDDWEYLSEKLGS
jgi:mannose-6-phosphate isomerase-like protein (cupin superfamily)